MTPDEQRLFDQVAYLQEELDALEPLITALQDDLLTARLRPGDRSVKELYGTLIEVGDPEKVDKETPQFSEALDPRDIELRRDWNSMDIREILEELREQRGRLVERLKERGTDASAVEFARWIVTADLACQRQVGERLFDIQPGGAA